MYDNLVIKPKNGRVHKIFIAETVKKLVKLNDNAINYEQTILITNMLGNTEFKQEYYTQICECKVIDWPYNRKREVKNRNK